MKTRSYAVKNLHCSGCSAVIQGQISNIAGVEAVNIDLQKQRIFLEYEEGIEDQSLLESINRIADKVEPGTVFYQKGNTPIEEEKNLWEERLEKASFIGMFVFLVIAFLVPKAAFAKIA